jgi:hypothetical protein
MDISQKTYSQVGDSSYSEVCPSKIPTVWHFLIIVELKLLAFGYKDV